MTSNLSRGRRDIRRAQAADLAALQACAHQAYQHYVARLGKKPAPMVADFAKLLAKNRVFVAETAPPSARRIAGFIVFYPRADHLHIENVAVLPELQRQGYGSHLLAYAERVARDAGFDRVELYTNAAMHENFAYYAARGYCETARRLEHGFNRVFFCKRF